MKEGEKITINFANMPKSMQPPSNTAAPKKVGGGLRKLAPPPGFKGKPRQNNGASASVDLLGGNAASVPS